MEPINYPLFKLYIYTWVLSPSVPNTNQEDREEQIENINNNCQAGIMQVRQIDNVVINQTSFAILLLLNRLKDQLQRKAWKKETNLLSVHISSRGLQ